MILKKVGGVANAVCSRGVSDDCKTADKVARPLPTYQQPDGGSVTTEPICDPCMDKLLADGDVDSDPRPKP